MALIVEDGTGIADANSYVSEQELTDYLLDRGLDLSRGADPVALIIRAMDYIESKDYRGSKTHVGQALKFPREGVHLDGEEVAKTSVPKLVKMAVCQLAYDANSQDLMPTLDGKVIARERVEGAVDVSYDANLSSPYAVFTQAEALLSKFYSVGSIGLLKVNRA